MYGLSDQSKGMPRTRLSADLARLLAIFGAHRAMIRTDVRVVQSTAILGRLIRVDDELPPSTRAPESGAVNFSLELVALLGLHLPERVLRGAPSTASSPRGATRIMELEHQGNRRARAVLKITADPPRFISAMQLGVTISSLAIGALGEQVLAQQVRRRDGVVPRRDPRAPDRHLPARRDRRARPERDRPRPSRADRARRFDAGALVLRRLAAADLAAPVVDDADPAHLRPRAARRGARGPFGGRAAHAALELGRAGRDRARRAGDALQGLRLRRQGGLGRDGAAPRGRRDLDRAAGARGAPGSARVALHALSGLSRVARRHRRRAAHPRPDRRRCTSEGSRNVNMEDARPPGVHGSRDEGARRRSSPSSGERTSTSPS